MILAGDSSGGEDVSGIDEWQRIQIVLETKRRDQCDCNWSGL